MKKILLLFLLMCIFMGVLIGNLTAQTDVQNTGVLYTGAAVDTVYIGGSFTNSNTGSFTNNTVLNVKQHVSNSQAAMGAGTGTLYLNGAAGQNINGSQVFKTFHLVTDNATGITLNNDLSVSGVHTYTSGMIITSATPNYMIYEAGSSYSGSNDSRHVNGWVKKLGNTNFTFPVGNSQYERSIALSSLGAVSEFAVRHYKAVSPNYTSLYGTLVLVDTSEYWTINRISGGSAVVTMNWDDAKIPVPHVMITAVQAAYWDGTFWRSFGGTASGSTAATGSVVSNSTNAFNTNFTIGSTALVLPVQLVSFTGQRNNAVNEIKWQVANESGIRHYQLQRSNDGLGFSDITTIAAYNNQAATSLYAYNDPVFMTGKIFYRLKYTDVSGIVKYTGVIAINGGEDISRDFYIVNNPVPEKIDLFVSTALKGNYMYTITATSGQVVQTGVTAVTAGGIYSIALRNRLAAGVYVLTLQNSQHTLQKNILKQ